MGKIIISPYKMHRQILAESRKENPFFDVKVVSKESLIGEWLGKLEPSSLIYLMKEYKLSYDNARALMPFIPYINEKLPNLFKIKQDLIDKHFIIRNEYLDQFFKNKEIEIVGYSSKDKELIDLLDHFGLSYKFDATQDICEGNEIIKYDTAIDEVFYSLNKIASLIDSGIDINNIYIYSHNESYKYYLEKFSKSFGFSLGIDNSFPIYNTSIVNRLLSEYVRTKDLNLEIDCSDESLLTAITEIINEVKNTDLSFEQKLDYLIGEFKNTKYQNEKYDNVVKVINSPIYVKDAHIFVLGFTQGTFPVSYKDNRLLSDIQRDLIGMNSSETQTQIDEDLLLQFLSSDNHFYYSYATRSLSEKFFVSPWVETFHFKEVAHSFPEVLYSNDMRDFYYAKYLDLKRYYSEVSPEYYALKDICSIPYGEYNNEYQTVNHFNKDDYMSYSYSQINTYYECPFQYYLSRVLDIDPFEGNFFSKFGNVAHKAFEECDKKGFDFEDVFNSEVLTQEFLDEELPIVENLKRQVKEACEAVLLHKKYMKNPRIITEKNVKFSFAKNSWLSGKIDKSIILDNKYLAIVDYKTGNDSFDEKNIKDGCSLQLPTYCLLAKNDSLLKDYSIMGVFINNVIDTSLTSDKKPEELINPHLRLNGKVVADLDIISYLDNTISGEKSEFIKGVSLKKDGTFKASNSLASSPEFDEYISIALEKYIEADTNIRSNVFSINPLYKSKSDNACIYCPYRDICFVRSNQRRYLSDKNPEESEDEDDE